MQFIGSLEGVNVSVLKDDGCNSNMISKDFVQHHKHLLGRKIRQADMWIRNSKAGTRERSGLSLENGHIAIQDHSYSSGWVVGDSRYDVTLGMPWHVQNKVVPKYEKRQYWLQAVFCTEKHQKREILTSLISNLTILKDSDVAFGEERLRKFSM